MKRREFIVLLGGATAARALPGSAQAQAPKILRVGIVSVNKRNTPFFIAFEKRMRELGYNEGNLAIEFLNVPSPAEYPKAYQELVQRHVNIIIALGPELALKSAIAATSKLPIVMVAIDYDPFALGYVTSLAHPTGNVTGVYFQEIELPAKRLELAKEMMPGLRFAAVF